MNNLWDHDCLKLTPYAEDHPDPHVRDMQDAIRQVVHLGDACLVAHMPAGGGAFDWDASHRGFACN